VLLGLCTKNGEGHTTSIKSTQSSALRIASCATTRCTPSSWRRPQLGSSQAFTASTLWKPEGRRGCWSGQHSLIIGPRQRSVVKRSCTTCSGLLAMLAAQYSSVLPLWRHSKPIKVSVCSYPLGCPRPTTHCTTTIVQHSIQRRSD